MGNCVKLRNDAFLGTSTYEVDRGVGNFHAKEMYAKKRNECKMGLCHFFLVEHTVKTKYRTRRSTIEYSHHNCKIPELLLDIVVDSCQSDN
jgi:hypothetical protein